MSQSLHTITRSAALTAALFVLALLALSCAESSVPPPEETSDELCEDLDQDGYLGRTAECPSGTDCNDRNPMINPAATEICGNGIDENCDGQDAVCETDCPDRDGDNFLDAACGGTDCNDNDPTINPRANEICGNGIDENCDGQDDPCIETCNDADGDGFGTAGSTGCPGGDEVDCDDTDPDIFPGATEVCDGVDNDCDGVIDECAAAGQSCVDGACLGEAGAECDDQGDCDGENISCDTSVSPGICRGLEGASCQDVDDCVTGLDCEGGTCSGSFCATNDCDEGDLVHCDDQNAKCTECPYWLSAAEADAACPPIEQCVPGGWCAQNWDVRNSNPIGSTTEDLLTVSIALADCFRERKEVGERDVCYAFWIFSAVGRTIEEDMLYNAYYDGDLDGLLGPADVGTDRDEALDDLWGVGLFNIRELDWKQDLLVGQAKEICVWYEPGFLYGESLTVDRCDNFAP